MKKTMLIFLSAVLMLSLLAGCGKPADKPDTAPDASPQSGSELQTEERTIIDALGREVKIPAQVKSIVPLGNTPRMVTYLGVADRVVGIGECEKADSPIKAYAWVSAKYWEGLPNVGTDAMGETAYYPEVLIETNPDVILCTYAKDVVEDIAKQTGLPVVAVGQGTLFGEDYEQSLRILGEVCGVSERAESIISFINTCLDDLSQRTKDVPDDKKPTVLAAAATFSGSHGIEGVYSNYPVFKIIAANDVALGISEKVGGVLIEKEKVLDWNPDMLFLDFSGAELVKTDYAQNPGFYKQLKAVTDGNVYVWPNSTWHWSNVEMPLVSAYYTAILLYPEEFADVDFETKAAEIFGFFIGDGQFLQVLEQAGAGYGKVDLGQ